MSDRENRLVLNVRGGARICVPAAIDQITPYVLLEQEDWFEDEIRFVRRWLRPGMRALDVGASYGMYTLAMALAVGRSGRVWSYEPTPGTADFLRRSLDLNECGNVSLTQAAVSDRAGTVGFAVGKHSELNAIAVAGGQTGSSLEVTAVTLDQAAADLAWGDIDFVKLDVEGHEVEALRGGESLFTARSPLVMFEVKAHDKMDFGVLEPMARMGYGFYRLAPGPLILTPFDEADPVDPSLVNLFACKSDRAEKLAAAGMLAGAEAVELPVPSSEAWLEYARGAPYARGFAGGWRSIAGSAAISGGRTYLEGLAAFAHSRDAGRGAAEQLAWLNHAYRCVAEALDASDTVARRISLARIAWELGWRRFATEALAHAADRVVAAGAELPAEPFLAPSGRFERLAADGGARDWLTCAVVEQFERVWNYSSIYSGERSLELLEPVADLRFRSAEVDRRRQLIRMFLGMQAAPEPAPLLCARTDENLNPRFWSGEERVALASARRG